MTEEEKQAGVTWLIGGPFILAVMAITLYFCG
jgi:hypothetical protein